MSQIFSCKMSPVGEGKELLILYMPLSSNKRYNLGSLTSANTALPALALAAISSYSQKNTFLTLRMCIFFTVCCRIWVYVNELLCTGMISWNGTKICCQVLQVLQVPALHNLENVARGTCDNPEAAPSLMNQIDPIAQKSEELPSRGRGEEAESFR